MSGLAHPRKILPKGPVPTVIGIVKAETATKVTVEEDQEELTSKY